MKRTVAILVLLLFLLGIFQVSLSFHYCGKNFKYITLNKGIEKKSCCKGKMKMHGCCTDKEVAFDIDDDQATSSKYIVVTKDIQSALTHNYYQYNHIITYPVFEVHSVSHSPPLTSGTKLNVLYCTYLI